MISRRDRIEFTTDTNFHYFCSNHCLCFGLSLLYYHFLNQYLTFQLDSDSFLLVAIGPPSHMGFDPLLIFSVVLSLPESNLSSINTNWIRICALKTKKETLVKWETATSPGLVSKTRSWAQTSATLQKLSNLPHCLT